MSAEHWNPGCCLVTRSSKISPTVMQWQKARTFYSRRVKRAAAEGENRLDSSCRWIALSQSQKWNSEMLETLARKTSGEILWCSRRGESVTRAVGVRMGWGVEEHVSRKVRSACLDVGVQKEQEPGALRASSVGTGDWWTREYWGWVRSLGVSSAYVEILCCGLSQ